MKRVTVSLLSAFVVVMAACGGGPLPGESVAAAAEKAKAAGSSKVFMSMEQQLPQGTMTMEGNGAFDYEQMRGSMTFSTSIAGVAQQAPQSFDAEMLFEGFVMYMKMPQLQQILPPGKTWVKFDLAKMSEKMGIDFQQLAQMGQNNPAQGLEYLNGATDVKELGTEDVRGVSTTHYSGTIDMDKLAEEAETESGAGDSIRKLVELSGMSEIPFDVWLDDEGLPRRMTMKMTPSAASGEMNMTMEMFDYGTDVQITIPPAAEVVDFQEMLGAQRG